MRAGTRPVASIRPMRESARDQATRGTAVTCCCRSGSPERPPRPIPASVYSGDQVIAIKTDGTTFKNGDAWKCITCGVTDSFHANRQRPAPGNDSVLVDHPQPMHDGTKALIGTNILDCGAHQIVSQGCTLQETKIYPIAPHLQGAILRELRLHPDDVHIGFNQPILSGSTFVDQFGVFARLEFDPAAKRYELRNVSFLVSPEPEKSGRFISVDPGKPDRLLLNAPAGVIGNSAASAATASLRSGSARRTRGTWICSRPICPPANPGG